MEQSNAFQHLGEGTPALFIKVSRHLGIGVYGNRVAQPAPIEVGLQTFKGVSQVDARRFEDLGRSEVADAVAGDAGEAAGGTDELVADFG